MKYYKVLDIALQNTFVYRWNFLLRSLFGLVPLVGTFFIWRAVFAEREEDIAGYEFTSMIYYFLLITLADNLITPTEDEWQIASDIRDGLINTFLIKPMNYLGYRFSLYVGYRLLYTAVTLPIVGLLFFLFRNYLSAPSEWTTWPLTFLSLMMAAAIQFLIAYSLAMMAFWILEISTIVFILYSFEYFLSGHLFPLDIMPAWFQGILKWLPFKYELFFPVHVFMEKLTTDELMEGLLIQAGWVGVMFLIAQVMWRRGIRKYQAVGG